MTIDQLVEIHSGKAIAIMADKSLVGIDTSQQRADQLVVANRHLLCCWILSEATEADVLRLSAHGEELA